MLYTIIVSEQEKIEGHTPEGMSPFSIRIVSKDDGGEGWTGMFAPSDILHPGLSQAERALRIASFVALEVHNADLTSQDTGEDMDEATSMFVYGLDRHRKFPTNERLAILKIRALGNSNYTLLPWPDQYSIEELANRAQSELTKTALQKVSQAVRAHEPSPASKPKI